MHPRSGKASVLPPACQSPGCLLSHLPVTQTFAGGQFFLTPFSFEAFWVDSGQKWEWTDVAVPVCGVKALQEALCQHPGSGVPRPGPLPGLCRFGSPLAHFLSGSCADGSSSSFVPFLVVVASLGEHRRGLIWG